MAHPLVQFDSGRDGFRDLIANFLAKAHRMRSRSMEYGAGRIAKRIVESTELTHTIALAFLLKNLAVVYRSASPMPKSPSPG
jgi:hypothetical protein